MGRPPLTEGQFWDMVDRSGGPDACWPWTGRTEDGYGRVYFRGKNDRAHRVAWLLTNGEVPEGYAVCHRCDHPPCCNPRDLWLGTWGENNADRDAKGRQRTRTKTRCKNGHAFTPENTMERADGKQCRTCHNERRWARYHGLPAGTAKPPQPTLQCRMEGCDRKYLADGWCQLHYHRVRRHGSPDLPAKPKRRCKVEGCGRRYRAKGYCYLHDQRVRRHGTPH